jgi:hypothetical protein
VSARFYQICSHFAKAAPQLWSSRGQETPWHGSPQPRPHQRPKTDHARRAESDSVPLSHGRAASMSAMRRRKLASSGVSAKRWRCRGKKMCSDRAHGHLCREPAKRWRCRGKKMCRPSENAWAYLVAAHGGSFFNRRARQLGAASGRRRVMLPNLRIISRHDRLPRLLGGERFDPWPGVRNKGDGCRGLDHSAQAGARHRE